MFTNLSSIRFAGEPYLSAPVPALPPLRMKSLGKYQKRKATMSPSTHNILINNNPSASRLVTNPKSSKSKVAIINSNNNIISASNSKDKKKSKKDSGNGNITTKKTVKLPVGDAVVVQLDNELDRLEVDQNANVEPFDEQISKDIAMAVAMIVAEHEMLKLKYPEKYDVDGNEDDNEKKEDNGNRVKIKSKKSKSRSKAETTNNVENHEENEGAVQVQLQVADHPQPPPPPEIDFAPAVKTEETLEAAASILQESLGQHEKQNPAAAESPSFQLPETVTTTADAATTSHSPRKSSRKASAERATSNNLSNDKASSEATGPPPPPPAVKRQPKSKSKEKMPAKNASSVIIPVPSTKSRSRTSTTAANPPTISPSANSLSTADSNQLISYPPVPSIGAKMGTQIEVLKYLGRIQNYMNRLGYHRLGEPAIRINTRLSMKMQMVTARDIVQSALPIKCLHAVVLAVYFTNCIDTVERFPIYFRSHVAAKEYKHIVLGIYVQGHFGALGISRDGGLQDKPTSYVKLSDLIFEFAKCYGQSGHILNEVKFGNIVTHDQHSLERMFNKNYVVPINGCLHSDIERNVEKFAKQLRAKMGLACLKSLRVDTALGSRFSRSKTSLNGNISASASDRSSTSLRTRALSMGPLTSSNRGSSNNSNAINKSEDISRRSSKATVVTRSKPPKSTKRK